MTVTHRQSKTPLYRVWKHIRERCHSVTCKQYPDYGGRGIYVCKRWRESFEAFASDMGPRPSDAHTIDRIDNDGPYSPRNCRWATMQEQASNRRQRRDAVLLTAFGKTQTIVQWSRETGIPTALIKSRIRLGWFGERILSEASRLEPLTLFGRTQSVIAWCAEYDITPQSYRYRIERFGWSPKKALTEPKRPRLKVIAAVRHRDRNEAAKKRKKP